MSKDLLQKALEASGKKDDIFGDSSEQPKRDIAYSERGIFVKEIIDGIGELTEYIDLNSCMRCGKERLIAPQTGACPICDKVMTLEAYEDYVKEYVEYFKDKGVSEESRFDNLTPKEHKYVDLILDNTDKDAYWVISRMDDKKKELKGLISDEGALLIITKELKLELPKQESIEGIFGDSKSKEASKEEKLFGILAKDKHSVKTGVVQPLPSNSRTLEVFETKKPKIPPPIPSKEEITKKQEDLNPNHETIDFALALKETPTQNSIALPTKGEIDYRISLIEYIKQSVVFKEDYGEMFGQTYLRASGYDKFIHYFKLNVSYPSRDVYKDEDGWHCDVICKIDAPWIQTVEGYGGASMNTMTIKKTRHNMKALADTRAKTRAVRCIMGFSRPSYEEMIGSDVDEIFGGK